MPSARRSGYGCYIYICVCVYKGARVLLPSYALRLRYTYDFHTRSPSDSGGLHFTPWKRPPQKRCGAPSLHERLHGSSCHVSESLFRARRGAAGVRDGHTRGWMGREAEPGGGGEGGGEGGVSHGLMVGMKVGIGQGRRGEGIKGWVGGTSRMEGRRERRRWIW